MSIVLKLEAKKGQAPKRGFEHYWNVMMDFAIRDLSFTPADIFSQSETTFSSINDYLRRLTKAGIIKRNETSPDALLDSYSLIERQSVAPKVRRDGVVITGVSKQKAMWNHMRTSAGAQSFSAHDLIVWASTDESRISMETAKNYIKALAKAGYLIEMVKSKPGKLGVWRLAPHMNTGPLPPMILRTRMVFDQNRHEIVGSVVAEEVQP